MDDKLGTNITDSVERVLRYIIPGVAFCLLFALSYPSKFDIVISKISGSGLAVFLIIITIGMSFYVIHSQIIRFTLELFVFIIGKSPVNVFSNNKCLCNYSKALAELIIDRNESQNYPKGYYTYLWSIIHYSFIMSYLLLFFAFFNEEKSFSDLNTKPLYVAGIAIWVLSFFSYWHMQALEKDTTAIAISKNKVSEERNNTST